MGIGTRILAVTVILLAGCSAQKYPLLKNKSVGSAFVKITDSLYAQTTEVTNDEYRQFLTALRDSGESELFKVCAIDSTGWRMKGLFNEPLVPYYHRHPGYSNHPVVNVSFEAANHYCNWLTEKYNANNGRKHKKVVFRLPSEEEWKQGARGTIKGAVFPWEGGSLLDEKHNWKAKFWVIPQDEIYGDTVINNKLFVIAHKTSRLESETHPSEVGSFPSNSFGLFDMAGNVGEMLNEKGKTKGGSWFSPGHYLKVDAVADTWWLTQAPNATIGFRVFAEIVEN